MKNILTGFILLIGFNSFGQLTPAIFSTEGGGLTLTTGNVTFGSTSWMNVNVLSKYDTTVLYNGSAECKHHFVSKKENRLSWATTCAVNHGPEGCPADWLNEMKICTICLKHIQVKETRYTEPIKDEYTEALNKLNEILKHK
jgi:hypothetical protein